MSRLWLLAAAALFALGGRWGKRAGLRGTGSLGVTSAIVNLVLKPLVHRARPVRDRIPAARHLVRQPQTTSFPSGHAASGFAFATGVALERPGAGLALAPVAAGVAYSRTFNGIHYPLDVLGGAVLGTLVALAGARFWPSLTEADDRATEPTSHRWLAPNPSGAGVVVIINPRSGSATELRRPTAEQIGELLPEAELIELTEEDDPLLRAREAAARAEVLGVCGGDGTLAAAAQAGFESETPLLLFPGGTMNHLARDLGLESAEDAAGALARGEAVRIDVASAGDAIFVNNATVGAHPELVSSRRGLEGRIGRWPAQALATARSLLVAEPVELLLDGRPITVWLGFIGNGAYHEGGIAPGWRRSLRAGALDVRLLEAGRHRSRARALATLVLAGGLRGRGLKLTRARSLRLEPVEGTLRLTRDGEALEADGPITIRSHPAGLLVYAPLGH